MTMPANANPVRNRRCKAEPPPIQLAGAPPTNEREPHTSSRYNDSGTTRGRTDLIHGLLLRSTLDLAASALGAHVDALRRRCLRRSSSPNSPIALPKSARVAG